MLGGGAGGGGEEKLIFVCRQNNLGAMENIRQQGDTVGGLAGQAFMTP